MGELLRRVSSHELSEWMAYDRLLAEAAEVPPPPPGPGLPLPPGREQG